MVIYNVQTGDTLYTLSKKFGVKSKAIVAANQLGTHPYLVVGQALLVPVRTISSVSRHTIEVYCSVDTTDISCSAIVKNAADYTTYLSPHNYTINENADISPANPKQFGNAALLMDIVRNDAQSLYTPESIDKLTACIADEIQKNNYSALQIGSDMICPDDICVSADLIAVIKERLKIPVFISIDKSIWSSASCFPLLCDMADCVVIKFRNSDGTPSACVSYDYFSKAIGYLSKVIPFGKIMPEIPMYGHDWELPFIQGQSNVSRISHNNAVLLAARNGSQIEYDTTAQLPSLYYTDNEQIRHMVWFEDARSVCEKLKTVYDFSLAGVKLEAVNYAFPQLWPLLSSFFKVKKVY